MENEAIPKPYVDYQYYKANAGGLSETEFEKGLLWATALIDQITFGRLKHLDMIPDSVKNALCCVIDRFAKYQKSQERDLRSESNDGYSVSYSDEKKLDDLRLDAIKDAKMYLSGTGLTYRGRSRIYDSNT